MTQRVLPSGGMPDSSAMRWDRARGHQTDQKKVRAVFHQIGQGEKEQQPPHPAVQQQSQSGGEQGGREQDQRAVARPGPCPFLRPQRAAEEEPAHVALRPRPLPGTAPRTRRAVSSSPMPLFLARRHTCPRYLRRVASSMEP